MTMKKKLAIILCSMPLAVAPAAFAQTGGATEGTTSPQSGSQTDMGKHGANGSGSSDASTSGGAAGSTGGSSSSGTSGSTGASGSTGMSGSASSSDTGTAAGAGSSAASSASSADAAAGESFQAKLKGKSVYNESDEKVGDVKDLVMSSDGKVTHVILGVGGFVGVGEHPVAIPFNEIQHSGDKLTLQGYTKDKLKEMPAYEYPRDTPAPAPAPASSPAPMGTR